MRLDITPQALSQRIQKKRGAVPMTTEEATYLIAHEEGIRIDKYVDPSTLDKIRQLTTQSDRAI